MVRELFATQVQNTVSTERDRDLNLTRWVVRGFIIDPEGVAGEEEVALVEWWGPYLESIRCERCDVEATMHIGCEHIHAVRVSLGLDQPSIHHDDAEE